MTEIEFQRLTTILTVLAVAIVGLLTLNGTLQSEAILGGAILIAVAIVAFLLVNDYQKFRGD